MNIAIKPENVAAREVLAGKVSLVTGSTSGIGLGIARALAAAGSEIVLNGFGKPDEIADVQAKIASDFKVRVSFSPADMSKPAAIREMIEQTLQMFGRLDILVNNAGIQHVASLQHFPPEKWDFAISGAASSTLPQRTVWSRRHSNQHMSPQSMALSDSPRSRRWRLPNKGSRAMPSARDTSIRRWSRRRSMIKRRHTTSRVRR